MYQQASVVYFAAFVRPCYQGKAQWVVCVCVGSTSAHEPVEVCVRDLDLFDLPVHESLCVYT